MPIDTNFRVLSLSPLMGELQANQLGFSTVFDASTPSDYFAQSMDRLNQFMTQRGGLIAQQGRPDTVEVMPPGYDPSSSMPYPRGQSAPTQPGGDVNVIGNDLPSLPAWDLTRGLSEFFFGTPDGKSKGVLSREAKIAIFVFVVGVLLFAAGAFSLR